MEPNPLDAAMASPPDPSTPDAAMEGQRAPASGLAAASALAASGQGAPDLGDAGLAAPLDGGRRGRWPCRAARRWPLRAGRWPCRGALIGMYSDLTNTKPSSCTIRAENASLIFFRDCA